MAETEKTPEELEAEAAAQAAAEDNPAGSEEEVVTPEAEEEPSGEDILGMSDDDFEKQNEAFMAQDTDGIVAVDDGEPIDPETLAPVEEPTSAEAKETAEAEPAAEELAAKEAGKTAETPADETAAGKAKASDVVDPEKKPEEAPKVSAQADPLAVDDSTAAAAYRKVFSPFKANGKMVQPRTPEEAITLMQMGANYAKSMKRIKPAMTMVKTLTNNGINSAEDLNYLVELKNGNPDAIKKLVRDAGINPLDIQTDDESRAADKAYRPKDYSATETQVDLDMALADVGSHPDGRALLESVQNDWDVQSRESIASDPSILHALNQHKIDGIYDQIDKHVKHEQMLGNLRGVPYLTAYQQIGEIMTRDGLFTAPATPAAEPQPQTETKSTIVEKATPTVIERKAAVPKPKISEDARAKAASSVKNGAAARALPANPLSMSDEDFEKLEGLSGLI